MLLEVGLLYEDAFKQEAKLESDSQHWTTLAVITETSNMSNAYFFFQSFRPEE